MKNIYKLRMAVVACSVLAATACTDYLDYNTVPEATDPQADKTLWENILENENLTEFAGVLERMGYDKVLNASRTYTVWAPVNGSYSVEELDSTQIERQFLKNIIADYAHRETDINDTVVYMLNGKLVRFSNKNTAHLAFDGKKIIPNTSNPKVFNYPSTNGLLYVTEEPATFRYNGYEYLRESKDMPQMMAAYVERYESRILDEVNSVKGAIIDGVQHYDDSVVIVSNVLTRQMLRAQLENEDSLYTILIPTDTAWSKAYDRIASYYKYAATIPYQDLKHADVGANKGADWNNIHKRLSSLMKANVGQTDVSLAAAPAGAVISETGAYWTDSVSKRFMTNYLVYSETNKKYNSKLSTGLPFVETDTLYTTTGRHLTNLEELDRQTEGEPIQLSNGHVRFINDFPFDPEETYAPIIKSREVGRVLTASGYPSTEESIDRMVLDPKVCVLDDEKETALRYVRTNIPDISTFPSEIDFYISDVLSTTYDVSLVVVPACVENPALPDSLRKPYILYVDINYADYSGGKLTLVTGRFNGEKVITSAGALRNVKPFDKEYGKNTVDTIPLGRVTFPVCYAMTDAKPNIKVMYPDRMLGDAYERNLRIANIILKPVIEENE